MKRQRRSLLAAALCVPFLLTACGTILRGTTQIVSIGSSPSNAKIWVDDYYTGLTPVIMDLARKDDHTIRIELPGYSSHTLVLKKKVAGSVFASFVLGIGIGLAIDAITGGLYYFDPDRVHVNLRKQASRNRGIVIIATLSPDPSWTKIGQLEAIRNPSE